MQYKYEPQEFSLIENSTLAFAIYQFINQRVVTIALSAGFCTLFGFDDRAEAYSIMDNDMYRDTHPDDIARIADAALRFATKDEPYDVIYRSKVNSKYLIIHARGEHIYKNGTRLAVVWYFQEGEYHEDNLSNQNTRSSQYANALHESSLYHQMQYDYQTGLPSMSYFFDLAEAGRNKMIEKGETPVILFFDLNGMKYFNLKYSFAEGNKLISAFSRLLTTYFSNENCCRFGMDRFCVYTNDIDLEKRLWQLFADAENINNGKSLPVRVGIYSYNIEKIDASYACDRAKMACDTNRNVYVSHFTYFDRSMLQHSETRQYIIDNFDYAINEGWIQVYYQPIIRTASGRVCDEEALARWIDPERGILYPNDFIPILEDANLIYKLDLYVAEQTLEKMKTQADKGLYVVPISVNLSRSDFDMCDIVSEIQKRVDNSGIGRDKLTIEITESSIGSDYEYMKAQIDRFLALGFKVWMDDFGSGYSSLDVLQDIRFNLMKIDMKFMQQFYKSEKSKIILTELIKMAVSLGIETIVEGVENEEQVEFLREVGCTKMQGFFYCRPIPLAQILERYESGTQIGFENPAESEYYASLGKINLYDLSAITNSADEQFQNYFNTLPMAIIETNESELKIIRGNKSYRTFMRKYFRPFQVEKKMHFEKGLSAGGDVFKAGIQQSKADSKPVIIDETLIDGTRFHIFLRRIAVNPVTAVTALILVVLGVTEKA